MNGGKLSGGGSSLKNGVEMKKKMPYGGISTTNGGQKIRDNQSLIQTSLKSLVKYGLFHYEKGNKQTHKNFSVNGGLKR